MASVQQHLDQWKHNRRFAKTIDAQFRDWQINVIFYAALHVIDAALTALGERTSAHEERNEKVKTNGSFAAVRNQYMNLYRISRVTRYDADPDKWLPEKYLTVNDLVEDLLKPIEIGVEPLIGREFKAGPLKVKE